MKRKIYLIITIAHTSANFYMCSQSHVNDNKEKVVKTLTKQILLSIINKREISIVIAEHNNY